MSLVPGTMVHQGNVVGGVMPDISSALGYKETVGSACINPNGYTAGSYFVGANDGYFYNVTANIAAGATITVGTNCVRTDVGAEIKQINSDLTGLKPVLLWTNPNPTAKFAKQTIALDLSKYDILIVSSAWATDNRLMYDQFVHIDNTQNIIFASQPSETAANGSVTICRTITANENSIAIGDCHYGYTGSASMVENFYNVPIKIYGIK